MNVLPPNEGEEMTYCILSEWGNDFKSILDNPWRIISITRQFGIELQCKPRHIHFAQLLCWKFYLKKKSEEFSPEIAIPIFYRIIQDDYHLSPNFNFDFSSNGLEKLILNIFKKRININPQNIIDFRNKIIEVTEYKHNLHHPSEFLSQFITSQFKESDIALAQCIISDSFSNPCCILYLPQTIAEGAAILAAAMNENKDSVIPKLFLLCHISMILSDFSRTKKKSMNLNNREDYNKNCLQIKFQ